MKKLVRNGVVVSSMCMAKQDIYIENGKITALAPQLPAVDAEVIDAAGRLVFPGFIDGHTHFSLDNGAAVSPDDFCHGTRAAIAGGTTTIVDYATQNRGETLQQALGNWHAMADGNCSCDYAFHMAMTEWNGSLRAEMPEMLRQGVSSYKLYMAYDNLRVSDGEIFQIIRAAGELGSIVCVHCENGDLIRERTAQLLAEGAYGPASHPLAHAPEMEAEAVGRLLSIAKFAGYPVNIVHLSTRAGLEAAMRARAEGQTFFLETCPQYLLLDDAVYERPFDEAAKYVMSPPPRKQADAAALWAALAQGEIDTVATDHCSFTLEQKRLGAADFSKIPNGAPGVQDRPQLMYTYGVRAGKITPLRMAKALAETPARLYGMFPRKGAIAVGSDADLVIWDESFAGTLRAAERESACGYSGYEGMELLGRADTVLLRGETVVSGGKIVGERQGKYIARGESDWIRN